MRAVGGLSGVARSCTADESGELSSLLFGEWWEGVDQSADVVGYRFWGPRPAFASGGHLRVGGRRLVQPNVDLLALAG
jgi:hypothetical protein